MLDNSSEVDLGVLAKKPFSLSNDTHTIFAECKSYNEFKKTDVERMQKLFKSFPGAVVVFSTFRESLSSKEKKLFTSFVKNVTKEWDNDYPQHTIIILTGTELFTFHHFEDVWEQKGDMYKPFLEQYDLTDLRTLGGATQQIYLGLPSLQERLNKRIETRKTRKYKNGK